MASTEPSAVRVWRPQAVLFLCCAVAAAAVIVVVITLSPQAAAVPIYRISMDTAEDRRRHEHLNFEYRTVLGYDGSMVPPELAAKLCSRTKGSHRAGTLGCFYSHYKAWQGLGEDAGIIVESDALQVAEIPSSLPLDGITLLGGVIRGPQVTKEDDFAPKLLEILESFDRGVNAIDYSRFSWTMSIAYYLPPTLARQLVSMVDEALLPPRAVDRWLNRSGLTKYLYFPEVFHDMPNTSLIGSPKGDQHSRLYVCTKFRNELRKPPPPLNVRELLNADNSEPIEPDRRRARRVEDADADDVDESEFLMCQLNNTHLDEAMGTGASSSIPSTITSLRDVELPVPAGFLPVPQPEQASAQTKSCHSCHSWSLLRKNTRFRSS